MNETELLHEIGAQWADDGSPRNDRRPGTVTMLARLSVIAWNELAHPPSAAEQEVVRVIAERIGTRSTKPRMVLRKLIEFAEREHGWTATPSVLRAAGRRVPS